MSRTDESEVVVSTHLVDSQGGVEGESSLSPNYTDTEVTQSERSIRFWNVAIISDTSVEKERKFMARVSISGPGGEKTGNWEETEYISPLPDGSIQPDKTFNVPDYNQPEYNYQVKTEWELWEKNGGPYERIGSGATGDQTATVYDNSVGG